MTEERISKEELYVSISKIVALRSRCNRNKVGAVIVKDNSVIATGCNGPVLSINKGSCNCSKLTKCGDLDAIHAEVNAISSCARHGISTLGTTMYITLNPCMSCAKLILQSGISKVFFENYYRDITPIDYLKNHGIIIEQYNS
jgi:dCMP deaminase